MKLRVTAYVAKTYYWWDFQAIEDANAKIGTLLKSGLSIFSKSGVLTFYPPHRVHKITRRTMK